MRSRRGRATRALLVISTLITLLVGTGWNVSRSDALAEAERAYTRLDLVASLQHALDHLARRPWSREAGLLAARCLSRLDFADQAEAYYTRAGRLSLADQQIRAYGLVRGPHPERAIPAYREILRLAPDNVTAMRRLAAVLLAKNDKDQLLDLADRLDRVPGGEVIGAMLRGTVYHNDKNPQMAVPAFERALALDPDFRQMPASRKLFWIQLTDDLIECGRVEDAGRRLQQALAAGPDAELLDRLGYTWFLRGDLDEAERCYREAADSDPTLYAPHLSLAKLALQRRRQDEALAELNQARQLAPRRYGVLYTLALLYRQVGQPAEADRMQRQIQDLQNSAASSSSSTPNSTWPRYAL